MSSLATFGWKNRKRRRASSAWIKNLFLVLLILFVCGTLGVLGLFAYVSRDLPDPNALTKRTIKQSTKIYDRTSTHLLYEIAGNENRTLVKVQQGFCKDDTHLSTDPNGIPLYSLQATIASEDHAFCEHHGFTLKGLGRAALFSGSRGGGSTLTQQLVKNAILSNEKTLTRKIKELILSVELERRYSKDEILQIYFNEIPYGSTYYGIQAASTNFFHKPVKELTLAEAATLAAIPQLPTFYINNPDRLKARRDAILEGMAELGYITKEQAAQAWATDTPIFTRISHIEAPHFTIDVQQFLEQTYGRRQVEEGGLQVITTLDYDLQKKAEAAITKGVEARGKAYKFNNAALVAIDPKTGQVLAMVGSKDYFDNSIKGKNNVTTSPRQPGSSFKPIVYTKAFSLGYTPNTILWDVKTIFPTPTVPYEPTDYDLKERGPIRVRDALQGSLNIPAVEMLYMVGIEHALDFANSLGYTTFNDRSRFGLAVVLGGGEVKLLEHTNAYATLANEGVRHDIATILSVKDAKGNTLTEWRATDGQKVIEPNHARMTTDVLSDNAARAYIFGPKSSLQLEQIPVAAKSGTTNKNYDAWTMGYVPSLATGVWVGNTDNEPMTIKADGSVVAAPIWNDFMKAALADKPIESFQKPEIPVTGRPVLDGQLPGQHLILDRASGKIATEYTPISFREERIFAEYHSLLHYVDRADPLGPPPANPQNDPYYQVWEGAIADWIAREEARTGIHLSAQQLPTEMDDIHVPANFPNIFFNSPAPDTEISGRVIDASLQASAPRGISRVEFYIDGKLIAINRQSPYALHQTIPSSIGRGVHTLKGIAYDDTNNSGSTTLNFHLNEDSPHGIFDIMDPKQNQIIVRDIPQYHITLTLDDPKQFSLVTLYVQSIENGEKKFIGSKINPDSPFLQIPWDLPDKGDWILSAVARVKSGGPLLETAGTFIHIQPGFISTDGSPNSPLNPFPLPPPTPKK